MNTAATLMLLTAAHPQLPADIPWLWSVVLGGAYLIAFGLTVWLVYQVIKNSP